MKTRILSVVALMLITLSISAQSIGIQAGYVNSTSKVNSTLLNTVEDANGFQVGVVTESNLIGNLDLHYGVLYNLLAKTDKGNVTTTTYTGHFVDVPVQAQFTLPVGPINVFAFGGPTLNFSIDQRTKTTVGSSETVVNHHDLKDSNDKKVLSRFDVKLGAGAGVRYSNLELRVGYDWGLLDLNSLDNVTSHRNQLTAAVVYKF